MPGRAFIRLGSSGRPSHGAARKDGPGEEDCVKLRRSAVLTQDGHENKAYPMHRASLRKFRTGGSPCSSDIVGCFGFRLSRVDDDGNVCHAFDAMGNRSRNEFCRGTASDTGGNLCPPYPRIASYLWPTYGVTVLNPLATRDRHQPDISFVPPASITARPKSRYQDADGSLTRRRALALSNGRGSHDF